MSVSVESLEANVDKITLDGKVIYLIGTAHVSASSAALAERIISEVRPDAVAVELCSSRFESLRDPDRWKRTDLVKIFLEGKPFVFYTQLVLAAFQKKIGDRLKVKPGAEMLAAIEAAEKVGAKIILADREVKTTLRRAWASIKIMNVAKLFFSSLWAMIKSPHIDEKEIERLKSPEALDSLLREFTEALPDVKVPLIDERDHYLASKIKDSPYQHIVAVVGAGHCPGIKESLGKSIDIGALEKIPEPTVLGKMMRFFFPIIFCCLVILGARFGGWAVALLMVKLWAAYTSLSASVGAALAFAHPLTIILLALGAPLASLAGFGGLAWLAGYLEAMIRPPQDKDKQEIAEALTSVKGIWTNRISHILVLMVLTNFCTTIAIFWSIRTLIHLLFFSF